MARHEVMQGELVSLEADISGPIAFLKELGGKERTVLRNILSGVGTDAKAAVKRSYRSSGLSRRTGALYKGISRRVTKDGRNVIVSTTARNDRHVLYGGALAKGSLIEARDAKALRFKVDGKWVTRRSVKLPERPFITEPVLRRMASTAFHEKLDQLVEREVQKIMRRKAKEAGA